MKYSRAHYGSLFPAIKKMVIEAPDIRVSRVEAAKHALQNGTLVLHGHVIAARLLADPLHTQDFDVA
jgi:anti-sigma28 factor (negative regulator of flagellin synthesis)